MTDDRQSEITGNPENPYEGLDDEYHSTLEVDDSTGWRAFIVPGILVLFLVGALALTFWGGGGQPDPRIANRFNADQQEQQTQPPPAGSTITPPEQVQIPEGIETPDPTQPAIGGPEPGRTADQPQP
jgi:hypothetical protein